MFDENRPKINLEKSDLDRYIEYITIGLIAFCIGYTLFHYGKLPERIPMHFSYSGKVNSYGAKDSIWALNFIAAITVFGIFYLNKFPHVFNYPKKITPENARKYYTDATRMMRFINLGIAIIFAVICYQIINIALDASKNLGILANYIVILIVIYITFFPLIYLFKHLKKKN